jgi:tetratricopeptide (TPR) repeat protein
LEIKSTQAEVVVQENASRLDKMFARIRRWLRGNHSKAANPTVNADRGSVAVGRDIIGSFIQVGSDEKTLVAELVAVLETKGVIQTAEKAGLERPTVIKLAQRLKPDLLDFDQAVIELEHAVTVALDVIARGEQGANQNDFVNLVLARVAEKTRAGDFDDSASTIDQALAEMDANYRKSRVVLLEEGVKVDILRRDAVAVVRRVETIIAEEHPAERVPWLPPFRERYDKFYEEGQAKGINFSLSVAIEFARRMLATAQDSDERGIALVLLGNALWTLGEREPGTAHLEEAVSAYDAALAVFIEAGAEHYIQICQTNKNRLELVLKGEKNTSDS